MFPEYRELITKLKSDDAHFLNSFNKHNALDHQIKELELHSACDSENQIHELKKRKLHLKEEIFSILQKAG